MPVKLILVLMLLGACSLANAQTQKEFSGPFPSAAAAPATAEEKVHQKDFYTHHKTRPFKWKRTRVKNTAQYEFYKRVEMAAKEHQRALKKLHRPQYSNFLYYGHKRMPKKHAADKMKYCKECGIRH